MEDLIETITLDAEEANELAFKVKIEGTTGPAKVRLVCESDDVSYMFKGRSISEDIVQFNIPNMSNKLQEGTYESRVEVLVENRYFAPVQFRINFKKPVKVFAESVVLNKQTIQPTVKVSAISAAQPAQTLKQNAASTSLQNKKIVETHKPRIQQKEVISDADSIRELIKNVLRGTR